MEGITQFLTVNVFVVIVIINFLPFLFVFGIVTNM